MTKHASPRRASARGAAPAGSKHVAAHNRICARRVPAACIAIAIAALAIAGGAAGTAARAEPVTDQVLSDLQIATKNGCKLLRIGFNIRIRYVGHFPQRHGTEARISVQPIDPAHAAAALSSLREALRIPDTARALVKSIDFEAGRAGMPTLIVQFSKPTTFSIAAGRDFESIVIAAAGARAKSACKPLFPVGFGKWDTTIAIEKTRKTSGSPDAGPARGGLPKWNMARPAGAISARDQRAADAAMDEARAALKKGDRAGAARLLVKVLRMRENPRSPEAQELLGVVYQKHRQTADARSLYEDYLRRYPKSSGTEGVRQRLDAILTAQAQHGEPLRAPRSRWSDRKSAPSGVSTWTTSGSFSQFYVRDDSFRVVRDPTLPPILNADKEDHRIHRNALLSSFDLIGTWKTDQLKSKFRFSGTEEHDFGRNEEVIGVSALFLETAVKDWATTVKLGRQTRNTGGVLGRFDGALVSWQGTPWLRWNVVGGSPVASRRDEPFKDEKYFLGTSLDIGTLIAGFDTSFFAIQQQIGSVVDRQAIGAEFRYLDTARAAFLTVDYDTHFNEFNAAIFSGSWTFADKSVLSGGVDYRKSPYLTSWNALIGQRARTLFELLRLRTREELGQMALDRTATYTSASVGYSRYLTDRIQVSANVTAAHIDGTIASYGVDAMPSTGTELYYSAQVTGTSMIWDGDLFAAGVRLADREDSNTYALDLGTRIPLGMNWRINPRLLLSYREGKTTDLTEYAVLPTVLFNYALTKDLSFEMEVGARRSWREMAGVREDDTELFFTIGYRYDFFADGQRHCPIGALKC